MHLSQQRARTHCSKDRYPTDVSIQLRTIRGQRIPKKMVPARLGERGMIYFTFPSFFKQQTHLRFPLLITQPNILLSSSGNQLPAPSHGPTGMNP